ncbi:Kinesin motor domain family protein [Leishmania donovani]|uniref:Kinesin motor domain family protein n=1 Tax=Leishmania donovani TaxID=5661 RepID=A0A504YBR9_LEIDO|nr:Kinesin motor domain family protein [Leishmania donovani]
MAALLPSAAPLRMPCQVADRIHVYGRVRPPASPDAPLWITVDSRNTTLHCGSTSALPKTETVSKRRPPTTVHVTQSSSFTLDGVVGDARGVAAQTFFDSTARSCVEDSLLKGTNATVLCCGEKGTGKTTTMFGDVAVPGLCQRILASLFAVVEAHSEPSTSTFLSGVAMTAPSTYDLASLCSSGAEEEEARRGCRTRFLVKLSCLALRGEHVVDLLAEAAHDMPSNGASASVPRRTAPPPLPASSSLSLSARPNITMDPRGRVLVRNVSKVTCCSAADAIALIHQSRRAPSSAASPWSPGHVVVIVDVTCEEGEEASASHHIIRTAKLYLVDLAAAEQPRHRSQRPQPPPSSTSPSLPAAESVVTSRGARSEDSAIRHSLAILQQVITGLSSSSTVVDDAPPTRPPYKQSKLSMLLKGHLGGGCRTLVIAHVRSEEAHRQETLATLQLARRLLCVPEHPTSRVVEDPKRFGDASATDAQARSSKSFTGRVSDRCTSPSQTPAGAASDCHPLLRRAASSSATPVSAALTTGVMNFVAGRIAVLPVSTVLEMNTCFELLRQCVTERDIQLRAAITDLRKAEAATAAAFTALAASSARSSVSERYSGRSICSGGAGRRRMRSIRGTASLARDTPTAEGKCHSSMDSVLPTSITPLPRCNSLRTTLLHEPSPTVPATAGVKAGKGYGSAPSATGLSRGETKDTAPLSPLPGLSVFPSTGPNAAAATANAPLAAAAGAARSANEGIISPENEVVFAPNYNEAASFKPFAPLERTGVADPPFVSIEEHGKRVAKSLRRPAAVDAVGRAPTDSLGPSSSIEVNSTAQVRRSHSAADSALQASPGESSAFHIYTTQTAEGVQQVQQVRHEEEALTSLRLRLVAEVTGDSCHSDTALADECRYHEGQLTRRREALLRNFESWYRARVPAEDDTAAAANSLQKPAENSKQLTLGTMRRRLRRPATAGSAGSGGGGGDVGELSAIAINGVGGNGAYKVWGGVRPVLRSAASFSSATQKESADEAAAIAMSSDIFSAAGASSAAYYSM